MTPSIERAAAARWVEGVAIKVMSLRLNRTVQAGQMIVPLTESLYFLSSE